MFHSIPSKLVSTLLPKEKRLKQACSIAVTGLQTTLSIAKDVTGLAGMPGLQAGITSLLVVIDAIKKTAQNAEDVEKLANQIEGLNAFLRNAKIGRTFPPAVADRIGRLGSTLSKISEDMKAMTSRGLMMRLIHHDGDIQSISGHFQTVTWAIQCFMVESTLAIEFALDEHANRIEENLSRLHETTRMGFQQISARLDVKDGGLPRALFAAFDCNADRTRCFEGTRTDILDRIFRWINIDGALVDRSDASTDTRVNSRIFWINGSAGTGKTTIIYTVAEECRKRGILGASFFCSRDDAECSNAALIFTTIAYQLGIFSPFFQTEVSRVMASNRDIGYASIPYQLEQLIVNPLRSLTSSIPPCVVILDALDECRDSGTTSLILSSLSHYINELFPIKFLITSRPESHITTAFKDRELRSATHQLILHEVRLGVVESDITSYLSSQLALISASHGFGRGWPTMEDIRKLVQLSHGLFIFAATSVKFIEDKNYFDARGQLESLLLNAPPENEDTSPHSHLYGLYTQVLNHAFPAISTSRSGRLKMILGSIVLIRGPLSCVALEHLLEVKPSTVRETLTHLQSVLIVPDDDTRPIRLLHPSFFDFITSPLRCRNPRFVVNPEVQHTLLARACFQAMKGLRQDICRIGNPSILNNEVDDLSARIKSNIPSHIQYACRYWSSHLANALFSDVLVEFIKEFCTEKLLNWLEVCSLLGELRGALLSLNIAQQRIVKSGLCIPDTLHLLRECERFTLEFFPIIGTCSLQIYRSALLFTPKNSLIRKTYGGSLDNPLHVYYAIGDTWDACLRAMEGHTGIVAAVAFSPDGSHILSGSFDHTIRLWDAVSGVHLNTLRGHSATVTSVAFSPDGTRILSGSDDKTTRLWDVVSGAHLITLSGHSGRVTSVAFSPDGARVASGSDDYTLHLWDATGGTHLITLSGHSHRVASVAFSPDGTHIVSGSYDTTLCLWDASSGAELCTLTGHSQPVTSVAFSPVGSLIVSGSYDNTLGLWDVISGAHLNTLRGHSGMVNSVAFSPDGTRIVSASSDRTLRLWDAGNGAHLVTFSSHPEPVISVSFSPDGTRIVSGSNETALRLWDAVSITPFVNLHGHSSTVSSVAASSDGTCVVSGSHDTTLRLWDALRGTRPVTLSGHSDSVNSVAFSPDGTCLVSASNDTTLRLWDAARGVHIVTLSGHSGWVNSVAFSPDGSRIASGSYDKTLRVWDAVSGTHLLTLSGHSRAVTSLAFSPDGTHIISGSHNTLYLWDAFSGTNLVTLSGHSELVNSVAFSPDGTHIVSGSNDCTLRLWDATSGAHLVTLRGHSDWVKSVAFSPDGTRIVSGSYDKTLCVWDTGSGRHLDLVRGHEICVSSLARSLSSSWASFSRDVIPSGSNYPIFSHLTVDGWIHSVSLNRRICWIPLSCRPNALDVTKDCVVFGTDGGRVVILHFKDMNAFFQL